MATLAQEQEEIRHNVAVNLLAKMATSLPKPQHNPRAQRMLPFVEGPQSCRLKHCVFCGVT